MTNFITNFRVKENVIGEGINYKSIFSNSLLSKSFKQFSSTKFPVFLLMTATLLLITSPLATNEVFATHLSEDLKWQLVFVSSTPTCSNYHFQMMNTYNDIAVQYLDLYKIENSNYDPLCLPDAKFNSYYSQPDMDLIILVYDKNLGEKELHSNKMGGLYSHTGIDRSHNHVIIMCDCSTFYYSSPVWILSHELSHFVLYYKDYDMEIIEDSIHVNDSQYDQCLENYSAECKSNSLKLSAGDGGYEYSVMPIYEPAIESTEDQNVSIQTSDPSVVLDLGKMITKWWAAGKITDGDYANAVGYVVDSDVISSHGGVEILMTDGPYDDVITWEEMMEEINSEYSDTSDSSEEINNEIFSRVPANLISKNESIFAEENTALGFPEWFKNNAKWWAQDKITDKEFKKSVEYLVKNNIIKPQN